MLMIRTRLAVLPMLFICAAVMLALPALDAGAALTAYWNYDTDIYPNALADPGFYLHSQITDPCDPNGAHFVDPCDAHAQVGFGKALRMVPPWVNLWAADPLNGYPMHLTIPPDQGTIEMWIAPAWNGTNQGGGGIGGSGATQYLFNSSGLQGIDPPGLRLEIFNNNFPNDGGQLFAAWNDGVSPYVLLNDAGVGSTANWSAGQWHHVAFCWDQYQLGLFLDGGVVATAPRPLPLASHHDQEWAVFMFGHAYGGSVYATWNGWVDELVIWDVARYDVAFVPPGPLQDPTTCAQAWELGYGLDADMDRDCRVDLRDFAALSQDWMQCYDPNDPACTAPGG